MSKFKIGDRVVCNYAYPSSAFELVEDTKWHPHHDLIIEWLENKDAVVECRNRNGKWRACIQVGWYPEEEYRIANPKQTKIDEINQKIEELKQKVKELEDES